MGRFLILFLLVAILVFVAGIFFPFWVVMILVGLVSYLIALSPRLSFLAAGLSFGLVWFILIIRIVVITNSPLPIQMAELMGVQNDNLLWFGTGLLGFVIGGFSGMTGALLRGLFERKYDGVYRN
jgi:hypothetical protein